MMLTDSPLLSHSGFSTTASLSMGSFYCILFVWEPNEFRTAQITIPTTTDSLLRDKCAHRPMAALQFHSECYQYNRFWLIDLENKAYKVFLFWGNQNGSSGDRERGKNSPTLFLRVLYCSSTGKHRGTKDGWFFWDSGMPSCSALRFSCESCSSKSVLLMSRCVRWGGFFSLWVVLSTHTGLHVKYQFFPLFPFACRVGPLLCLYKARRQVWGR